MRKNTKKVDIIIIAVILLLIAGGILLALLPQNEQQSESTVSADTDGDGSITCKDYIGKPLGIMTGSAFEPTTLEKFPDSEYLYFNTYSDLNTALIEHKIDGYVADEPTMKVTHVENSDISYLPEPVALDSYYFMFSKTDAKSQTLLKQFNEMLDEMTADGTLAKLQDIWLGEDTSVQVIDRSGITGENGEITVGTYSGAPPFTMFTDGELSGFTTDLLYRFAQKYGYEPRFEDTDVNGMLAGLAAGKYDMLAAPFSKTPEREEAADFSEPFYSANICLAVRAEDIGGTAQPVKSEQGLLESIAESFEKNFIREDRWQLILDGIGTTCLITVLSALFGSLLAFLICMFRRTGSKLANVISNIYVKLLQGTPIVVLLMILYYVVLGKSGLEAVWVAIIGFTLNFGAYASEIMRSGIESIDGGQREAALALGYNENQAFFRFIFPQAAVRFLPVYNGEIVSLLKSTSIVGYIAIQDLTKMSDIIRSRTYEAFFPLIATAIIYFILAWIISLILKFILKNVSPKRRRGAAK